jgi:hypothetical protein
LDIDFDFKLTSPKVNKNDRPGEKNKVDQHKNRKASQNYFSEFAE